jgi:D-beta-D-heptose 7-phosphate kinase/D-beta-D-heptose 1-phosphate adenosyltransferase
VLSRDDLLRRFGRPREGRLVFTNGVFDLFHAGHLSSLEAARAFGDQLVVAVNSDASTRRLKGPDRPFQPEEDRARLVAGLRCVDAVTLFDEDTPEALIRALLPDVLVKGADYEGREVAGADAVRAAGGEVRLVDLEPGRSTSDLAARIREAG